MRIARHDVGMARALARAGHVPTPGLNSLFTLAKAFGQTSQTDHRV